MSAARRQSWGMVLFALVSLAAMPTQSASPPLSAQTYRAPVIRPYEPPSNFARVVEEGDGGGDRVLRVIPAPVSVEAYARSYEHAPSRSDNAYDAGVENAEHAMDQQMGPLDGRWLLKDAAGRTLMTVSLMDQGETGPLDGAYRIADAAAEVGPLTAERTGDALTMALAGGRLSLSRVGSGWTGTLTQDGRERTVSLMR